jgi:hypothetical protein
MGSADFSISQAVEARTPRNGSVRRLRAPWRKGVWSSAEVAHALQAQRPELTRVAFTRGEARGLPEGAVEEIVNEAICTVAMMPRPITCEEHLMGAFVKKTSFPAELLAKRCRTHMVDTEWWVQKLKHSYLRSCK